MVTVAWNSTTVETKKPQTSNCGPLVPRPGCPAFQRHAEPGTGPPSATGTTVSKRSSQRSSGYFSRSPMREVSVRKPPRVRNQPAWLRQKPLRGVMRVGRGIGVHMVVAMVRRPPQRAALHRRRAEQRERELHRARGAERAVREVAVVEAGDREHAQRVQAQRNPQGAEPTRPTHSTPRHARCMPMKGSTRSQSMRSGSVAADSSSAVSNQRNSARKPRRSAAVAGGGVGLGHGPHSRNSR
jgi:hypothetical protein